MEKQFMTPLGFIILTLITGWIFFWVGRTYQMWLYQKEQMKRWEDTGEAEWREENAIKSIGSKLPTPPTK